VHWLSALSKRKASPSPREVGNQDATPDMAIRYVSDGAPVAFDEYTCGTH